MGRVDKVEKNAENTQIKEESFTSENDSRTAENENSEVSTPPASDMAAPVMDAVIPQSEAVVVPQGMSESDVMSPETPPQWEQNGRMILPDRSFRYSQEARGGAMVPHQLGDPTKIKS